MYKKLVKQWLEFCENKFNLSFKDFLAIQRVSQPKVITAEKFHELVEQHTNHSNLIKCRISVLIDSENISYNRREKEANERLNSRAKE